MFGSEPDISILSLGRRDRRIMEVTVGVPNATTTAPTVPIAVSQSAVLVAITRKYLDGTTEEQGFGSDRERVARSGSPRVIQGDGLPFVGMLMLA